MASSSSDAPPPELQSFTTMEKDVEAIGAHCHYEYCNQLDFLPFRCESCKHTFCLEHRTESGHKCTRAGAWAAARRAQQQSLTSTTSQTPSSKPTLATGTQCSHPTCKTYVHTLSNVGVHCQTCNREYCLKHRFQDEHLCSTLTPLGARPASYANIQAQNLEKAKAVFGRLRVWGKEKASSVSLPAPKPKPSSPAVRALALNALKKSAKGDAKIPVEKRIYLHVEAEVTTTTSKFPKGDFWYSKEWSVGRMLDEAAKGLQIQNVNNRGGGEEEKLRVFHVEGGRLLEFGEKIGEGVVSGNTLVLLRGVGPAVPDLIGS
ncbi:MAG: hypothetical protein MMC33_004416 [Icmadophila ericetorum]|nr:hypothetical protein [Icmadophila ericetorum]